MTNHESLSGSRQERKKEETRKKIIDAAIMLIKKHGFELTSMEQIAEEADVARRTLYNHFPAKEAIIDEYIKRSFRENNPERILRLQKLPDTRSRMILVFNELIEGVRAKKEFFEKYIVYRMQNMVSFQQDERVKSGFYLLVIETIELGQKNGEIRNDLPLYMLEDLFEFAFIGAVKQFYFEPEKFNASEAIERCVDLFMNGASAETR